MIDIHTHILPFMDDGAENAEQSLRMCETALDNRVKAIVATPHFYKYDQINTAVSERDERITELRSALKENKFRIDIYPGLEVYCHEEIFKVTDFSRFTINNSRYMLCEFDFNEPDALMIMRYIDHISACGVIPVIAHPERYAAFLGDYEALNNFERWGTLFQLNVTSFTGVHGPMEKRLAAAMLQCGFCDFIASDAHSPRYRSTNLLETLIATRIDFIKGELKTLTDKNPRRLLDDEAIEIRRGYITYGALV